MSSALDFEKIIIKSFFINESVKNKVVPMLDIKWFRNNVDLAKIIGCIIEFNEKFENMPSPIELRQMLRDDNLIKIFDECMAISDEDCNSKFMLEEIEKFVKQKKLWNAASDVIDYLKTDDCNKKPLQCSFSEVFSDAEAFSFDTSVGFNYIDELDRIYNEVIKNEKLVKSGLKTIDELLYGGFHEKSISLILSPTNVGKTLIMCSLASNMIRQNYNVLYVTFEDSELKIGARITQNLCDMTQDQMKLMSRESYEKCKSNLKKLIHSSLIIKEYPESAINALSLKSLIKELKEKNHFVPDIMFVDYIGCMVPNGQQNPNLNTNTILLRVAAQVRAISMEFGFPIVSGSQVNRGGYDSAEVNLNDAADSFGQTMKADFILAVTQTPDLKEQNLYSLKVAKTRFGNNKGGSVCVNVDIAKQRISDLNDKAHGVFEFAENETKSNLLKISSTPISPAVINKPVINDDFTINFDKKKNVSDNWE